MEMGGGREDIHLAAKSITEFVADLVERYIYIRNAVQRKPEGYNPDHPVGGFYGRSDQTVETQAPTPPKRKWWQFWR